MFLALFAVSRSMDMLCKNATRMVLRRAMTSSVVISEAALLADGHGLRATFN